jgi:NADPH:quinone reductase
MRAVLCTAFEGIKSLTIGETAEPSPKPDEVLIDVYAASVSFMDYLMISGGYQMRPPLPYVPAAYRTTSISAWVRPYCIFI